MKAHAAGAPGRAVGPGEIQAAAPAGGRRVRSLGAVAGQGAVTVSAAAVVRRALGQHAGDREAVSPAVARAANRAENAGAVRVAVSPTADPAAVARAASNAENAGTVRVAASPTADPAAVVGRAARVEADRVGAGRGAEAC